MDTPPLSPHGLGQHLILDLYDCPSELLRVPAPVEQLLLAAAHAMEATVVGAHFHGFAPHGVSGVVVIL